MNEPKRHHYVTRAYMRRFSNDEHVYVLFKKDDNNCTITQKPTSIENICVETDFYTVFEEDEKKNSSVERLLARFEDETPNTVFSYIQPDLVFPFQEGGTILDAKQKKMIVDSIAIQIARGKSTREYGLSVIDNYYQEMLEETRRQYDGTPNLEYQLEQLKNNEERIKNNALVEGPVIELMKGGQHSKLRKNLQNRICFILINTTELDFVTSDEPVLVCDGTKRQNGIFHCPLGNWNSIVYYPLDPKHMVALYTKEFCHATNNVTGNIILLGDSDRSFILNANVAQLSQCNRCLIAKRKESLKDIFRAS